MLLDIFEVVWNVLLSLNIYFVFTELLRVTLLKEVEEWNVIEREMCVYNCACLQLKHVHTQQQHANDSAILRARRIFCQNGFV